MLFTGFLSQEDVRKVFRLADVYVMPSESEPFGLATLEAIRDGVPVVVSKQSGVSEVIRHALKVDFWDTEATADRIVGLLEREGLAGKLATHAAAELDSLSWSKAADACREVYDALLAEPSEPEEAPKPPPTPAGAGSHLR